MARFKRIEVYNTIYRQRLMPIFYHSDIEVCKQVVGAAYRGGCRVFELTNRGDFAHHLFGVLETYVQKEYPDLILGVGSIVDPAAATLYIQQGANFVVTPMLNRDVALTCNSRKIAWIPGCGTLTEISKAEELGAELVKIFPGNTLGGPDLVKAVHGPMPWVSMMATGGVTPDSENISAWMKAGTSCIGMGSHLFPADSIEIGDFCSIESNVRNVLNHIEASKV